MILKKFTPVMLFILVILAGCKPIFNHQITEGEMVKIITHIAGEEMKGRYPGTYEDSLLTDYLTDILNKSGLVPMADEGRQAVVVESGYVITDNNSITSQGNSFSAATGNMVVFGFSATDTVSGELYFAGQVPEDSEGLEMGHGSANRTESGDKNDTNGAGILMVPLPSDLPEADYEAYNSLRSTSLKIADEGYSGIIYITESDLPEITHTKRLPLSIPVVCLDAASAAEIAGSEVINQLLSGAEDIPVSAISAETELTIMTEVIPSSFETYNTIFQVKGSKAELRDEYVIIGAHHDHLGLGGRGSSSRTPDIVAIHYGADDNASGVAGVIEIGQYVMSTSPPRSFIFTTFAAEEMGLYGSKQFAEASPVPLEKVQAMINLDMIGRLNEDRQLQIGGVGTSPGFKAIIDSINSKYEFSIAYSEAGYGPSDHSSFYAKDVPVLFVSTGAHADYHTPADSIGSINFGGMVEVSQFVADIALVLGKMPDRIPFTEAGPKESSGSRGRRGSVTFGLMPDMMYDGNEGMPVSFVTEGKPAAIGGMKNGDIIVAVDSKKVGNVYDYMDRLAELKEGQSVVVTVTRDGKQIELLLKL